MTETAMTFTKRSLIFIILSLMSGGVQCQYLGNGIIFASDLDTMTSFIVIPDPEVVTTTGGVVTSIRVLSNIAHQPLQVIFFRKQPCSGCFSNQEYYHVVSVANVMNTGDVNSAQVYFEPASHLEFKAGDVVGFNFPADNPIPYFERDTFSCSLVGTAATYRYYDYTGVYPVAEGSGVYFNVAQQNTDCRVYSYEINYDEERCETVVVSTSSMQTITSPNYPSNYPADTFACWKISTLEPDNHVKFYISYYDFGVCDDQIDIYDGSIDNKVYLTTLCDSGGPLVYYSSNNQMYIIFFSDSDQTQQGFTADVYSTTEYFADPNNNPDYNNYNYLDGSYLGGSGGIDYLALYISLGVIGGMLLCGGIAVCIAACGSTATPASKTSAGAVGVATVSGGVRVAPVVNGGPPPLFMMAGNYPPMVGYPQAVNGVITPATHVGSEVSTAVPMTTVVDQ